jgi:hypothetical protein
MDKFHSQASTKVPDAGATPNAPSSTAARVSRGARAVLVVLLSGVLGFAIFSLLPLFTGLFAGQGETSRGGTDVVVQETPAAPAPTSSIPASTEPIGPQLPAAPNIPAGPVAAPPLRLIYPAAAIDVVIHPLEPSGTEQAERAIVPPATMDGYWLTPFGVPGAGSLNTTYIVGHSWQDREAPFNRLSTKTAAGDRLTVITSSGELSYEVEEIITYVKSGLKDSPVWEAVPNRLVVISCYTDDLWGTNIVVVASPVDTAR